MPITYKVIISWYLQTWRLNLKALEIAKQIQWSFYSNIAWDPTSSEKVKVNISGTHLLVIISVMKY